MQEKIAMLAVIVAILASTVVVLRATEPPKAISGGGVGTGGTGAFS